MPVLGLFGLVALPFLSSCEWIASIFPESFGPEYNDSSINLIAGMPLAGPSATANAGGDSAFDLPGVWDWGWREQTGNAIEYMSLSEAGVVGQTVADPLFPLGASEAVWRLELRNRAGDPYFEEGVPAGWLSILSATVGTETTSTSHGQQLVLGSKQSAWAGFDPNASGFILDSPSPNRTAEYLVWGFSGTPDISYLLGDYSSVNFEVTHRVQPVNGRFVLSEIKAENPDTRVMFARSSSDQTIQIDDLRVVRSDIAVHSALRLRLRPLDTYPALAPGRYEFSVWVKRPDDYLPPDADGRKSVPKAPFAAVRVYLEMRQVGFLDGRDSPKEFSGTFEVGTVWTRLVLRMGEGNLERFDRNSAETVLELYVYPFNKKGDQDAGALLLAAPRLRFFKNGYND